MNQKFSDKRRNPFGEGFTFEELCKNMKDWWFP